MRVICLHYDYDWYGDLQYLRVLMPASNRSVLCFLGC